MKVEFKGSFARDLKRIRDTKLLQQVRTLIEQIEQADGLRDVTQLKPLEGFSRYYRVRIGNYRVGVIMEQGTVTFIRCLHRKEIYRYFP